MVSGLRKEVSGSDCGKQIVDLRLVEELEKGSGSKVLADITVTGNPTLDKVVFEQQEEAANDATNTQVREEVSGKRKTGEKRKKQKFIKKKEFEANLVLGMDVQIEEAIEVAECTLVGRARGKKYSAQFIQNWAD